MNSTGLMLEFIMGTGRTTRDTVKEHSLSRTEKLYLAIGRTERSNMYQLQIIQVFSIINFNHIFILNFNQLKQQNYIMTKINACYWKVFLL